MRSKHIIRPPIKRRRKVSQYGITYADYLAMLVAQDRKCAICGRRVKLVIDHDHVSGRVRGLICYRCNTGLGHFLDTLPLLQRAVEYLSR